MGKQSACSYADGGKPGCQAQQRRWDWRNLPRESELKCCQTLDICHHSSSSHSCTASSSAWRGARAAFTEQARGWGRARRSGQGGAVPPTLHLQKLGQGIPAAARQQQATPTGLSPHTPESTGFTLRLFSESLPSPRLGHNCSWWAGSFGTRQGCS